MRVVDLFAGCGGMSTGLKAAGIEVVAGIDVDVDALKVYAANHAEAVHMDLTGVTAARLARFGPIDAIVGSPPCQDFSACGARAEGDRANLTLDFARVVCDARPRAFLMENVPLVLASSAFDEAQRMWVQAGYHVLAFKLNARECGVPQRRQRVFVLGVRDVRPERLRDLETTIARFRKSVRVFPTPDIDTPYVFYTSRNRFGACVLRTDQPYPALRKTCLLGPSSRYVARAADAAPVSEAHVLSLADAAAIAGFAPDYDWSSVANRKSVAARLLGNCVPPGMARVVGTWLREVTEGPTESATEGSFRRPTVFTKKLVSRIDLFLGPSAPESFDITYFGERRVLRYLVGTSDDDDARIARALGWAPRAGWLVTIRELHRQITNVDEIFLKVPDVKLPFRSRRALVRAGWL